MSNKRTSFVVAILSRRHLQDFLLQKEIKKMKKMLKTIFIILLKSCPSKTCQLQNFYENSFFAKLQLFFVFRFVCFFYIIFI
jgi:hypothetical protein